MQPTRLLRPWDFSDKSTGVGCHCLLLKESWVQKNWCFWTVCWRRLLRVPWTARRSNQSVLKEVSPEYSLEGLMMKLKFQYFGHLIWRTDSFKKTLCWERMKAWGKGDNRGCNGWFAPSTWLTWVWVSSECWWWTEKPDMLKCMELQRVGHNWATELKWIWKCDTGARIDKVTQQKREYRNRTINIQMFDLWLGGTAEQWRKEDSSKHS